MALRTIRLMGDGLLRKKSKPVKDIDKKIFDLLDDMRDTLKKHEGLGLSAPQVGVLKRVVIVDVPIETEQNGTEADTSEPAGVYYEIINPEIVSSEGEIRRFEGCLSLPGKSGIVARPEKLTVKALDRTGREYLIEAEGMLARALCHEIDHLDGILYVDKAEPESMEDEEDEDDFEDM